MNSVTYYFISYQWENRTMKAPKIENAVIEVHPLVWLNYMINLYSDKGQSRQILFWEEITKEQYNLIQGRID